ncbi:RNA-directed DNA polymerase, eukaryota, reverse transcriptase zinc-binding domain protein [Tanacetum coccineum]
MNNPMKRRHGYAVSSLMDTAYWSSECVLIEVSSETDLMDSIVIAIPYSDGKGHTLATIDIEYELRPPHCSTCKLFNHTNDACPKLPKVTEPMQDNTDGFVERVKHGETSNTQQKGDTSNASKKDHMNMPSSKPQGTRIELKNSFASLDNDEDDLWDQCVSQNALNVINKSDSEEVDEESVLKGAHQNATTKNLFKGASTPNEQSLTLIVLDWICYVRMCLDRPWCILGDFNAALNLEDSLVGSSFMDILMREFKECVEEIELMNVPRSGLQFTWNQKPRGTMGLLKKLDPIMANVEFSNSFVGSYAVF